MKLTKAIQSTVDLALSGDTKYASAFSPSAAAMEINNGKFKFGDYFMKTIKTSLLYKGDIIENALAHADRIYIPANKFESENLKYSPFEADSVAKDAFKHYDVHGSYDPNRPNYPTFELTAMQFILANGLFPTFDELATTYLVSYFEPLKPTFSTDAYKNYNHGEPPRFDIGKELKSNECSYENKVITLLPRASKLSTCRPCNVFTTDMVLNRIYKAYPSIIRKLYTVFSLAKKSNTLHYNLASDIYKHIHMTLGDKQVRIRLNTSKAAQFEPVRWKFADTVCKSRDKYIINFVFEPDNMADSKEFMIPSEEGINELLRISRLKKLYTDANVCANPLPNN